MHTHYNVLKGLSLKPKNFRHNFSVLILVKVIVKGSLCDVCTKELESKPDEKR